MNLLSAIRTIPCEDEVIKLIEIGEKLWSIMRILIENERFMFFVPRETKFLEIINRVRNLALQFR